MQLFGGSVALYSKLVSANPLEISKKFSVRVICFKFSKLYDALDFMNDCVKNTAQVNNIESICHMHFTCLSNLLDKFTFSHNILIS